MRHFFIREVRGFFHSYVSCVHKDNENLFSFIKSLPKRFEQGEGKVIYKGRNELREFHYEGKILIVKSFRKPHIINQVAYACFRLSKAQRSFEYAEMFLNAGIQTPRPIGYYTERLGFLFTRSYYVCLKSECPYTYRDLRKQDFPRLKEILIAIAETTARMHENGYWHKDYSAGNILFRDDKDQIEVEVIDLNRMAFGSIDREKGCRNFERLFGSNEMISLLAESYAKKRGFDVDVCTRLIKQYIFRRKKKN
jgi:tRNA A-37 threonylcarbamoyl transferase component Bud32